MEVLDTITHRIDIRLQYLRCDNLFCVICFDHFWNIYHNFFFGTALIGLVHPMWAYDSTSSVLGPPAVYGNVTRWTNLGK